MKPKESGWILSVDPASNKCGVALWKDGSFIGSALLSSVSSRDPFSRRMQDIYAQLCGFLEGHLGATDEKVKTIVTEGVRSRLVSTCIGSLMVCPRIEANLSPKDSFVEPSTWKKWAKDHGATGPSADIKGIASLKQTPWFNWPIPQSDDEADAILIYQAWRDRA